MPEMLRKILEKLPRGKSRKKAQKSDSLDSRASFLDNTSSAINLLDTYTHATRNVINQENPLRSYRILIFLVTLLFSVFLFIDGYLTNRLSSLKKELDKAENRVIELAKVETDAKYLSSQIDTYKQLKSSRKTFSEKARTTLVPIENSEVASISLNHTGFSFSAKASSPYAASMLINTYLEDERIDYIALESASLDVSNSEMRISIRGAFK